MKDFLEHIVRLVGAETESAASLAENRMRQLPTPIKGVGFRAVQFGDAPGVGFRDSAFVAV